ncbi:MAG: bifunctional (p)ppGpp synthetase/guanosine-3',5'-bis(diphosphate) 3'-pyrophosphohydrolase [Clostridia bacterium]|nr:bifunctional (p)ppGpp synthetase/guanosine-3',5'-bis(diphosphate) 3'-pyrophosphohydrolase [Clostridia bacterium]
MDDSLLKQFSERYTPEQTELFRKALAFAEEKHKGQRRESGEPYITHPLAVSKLVMDMGMDADSVTAALLHDVVEDCEGVTIEDITKLFGTDISLLVDGVTKLTHSGKQTYITKKQEQAENLRKLFLAIAKDVRVVIIKLADRLHNMRTIAYCSPLKRARKAKETLEVYAPLAHRFGMGAIKGELEDLSFIYLMPDEYNRIKAEFYQRKQDREELLNQTMVAIREKLDEAGIKSISISGRPKHLYSVYNKMKRSGCSMNEVYDLVALRIVVESINDCYAALGVMHSTWKPLPGRFKDYIATPKPNFYRSLHTTLLGENGLPFEVQIRTLEMHRTAEYGIAAHWMYKEGRAVQSQLDRKTSWLREIIEAKENTEDSKEFVENILKDFLGEYVFVLTPTGEIFDLPIGSTPLDFAYRIHTKIGHHCQMAKVNGNIVKLDYKLKTNDMVEIITNNAQAGPSRDWLKIVKTQSARNKIRQWFKKENREDNINRGRDMLEEAAKRQSIVLSDLLKPEYYTPVLQRFTMTSLDDLYSAIGFGGVASGQVLHKLSDQKRKQENETANAEKLLTSGIKNAKAGKKTTNQKGVVVLGEEGLAVHFGSCCNPLPGDAIIGYITRGRGVSVHRADCPNAKNLMREADRLIEVEWAEKAETVFDAAVQIKALNRPGTMLEITALLSGMNINIQTMSGKPTDDGKYVMDMTFLVSNAEQLNKIIQSLKKLKCVGDVYRVYH